MEKVDSSEITKNWRKSIKIIFFGQPSLSITARDTWYVQLINEETFWVFFSGLSGTEILLSVLGGHAHLGLCGGARARHAVAF